MAKPVKVRTSSGEWVDLAVQVPSANDPTFTGTTSSSQFNSTQSSGDEGGEIKFAKAATNTTIDTGVTLDVYQDKVRLFETAGTNRGGYFDMTTLGAGVATNLVPNEVVLSSGSFSAVSSLSISNALSDTYKFYNFYILATVGSSTQTINLRFRENTTDVATNYYGGGLYGAYNSTSGQYYPVNSGTHKVITAAGTTFYGSAKITIFRNGPTYGNFTGVSYENILSAAAFIGGERTSMTNFNGLTIFPNSSTMTGSYLLTGLKS